MSVDVQLVKQLRELTHVSLKDCKSALEATNGDLEAAQQWLMEKGLSSAAKKADRELNDGQIKIVVDGNRLIVIKVGCETDFVAKNEIFTEMLDTVASIITQSAPIASIDDINPELLAKAIEVVSLAGAKLGENIQILDVSITDLGDATAIPYLHMGSKIAAVVVYRNGTDEAATTAKQVAMQIAAMNPQYMTMDEIPSSEVEAKKEEFAAELKAAGKPESMIAQITQGKVNKYFADLVLMNQGYIGDEATTISQLIGDSFEFVSAHRFAI